MEAYGSPNFLHISRRGKPGGNCDRRSCQALRTGVGRRFAGQGSADEEPLFLAFAELFNAVLAIMAIPLHRAPRRRGIPEPVDGIVQRPEDQPPPTLPQFLP